MTFNIKKCKCLRISNKRVMGDSYDYNINGNILEQVNEHPYLGIELNNNLCWGKHIDMITAKASKTLNMVRRNFYRSPAISLHHPCKTST